MTDTIFDQNCRACPRLATFLDDVNERYPDYYCKPVPPFGDDAARFLIVGLAPGMHGANRTGRMFTGDRSGEWFEVANLGDEPVDLAGWTIRDFHDDSHLIGDLTIAPGPSTSIMIHSRLPSMSW